MGVSREFKGKTDPDFYSRHVVARVRTREYLRRYLVARVRARGWASY